MRLRWWYVVLTLIVSLALAGGLAAQSVPSGGPFTLQSRASTGNGAAMRVRDLSLLALAVQGAAAGADRIVTFQVSLDGTNYTTVLCTNVQSGATATSVTASGTTTFQFTCPVAGMTSFQAPVSAGSQGSVTVQATALPNVSRGGGGTGGVSGLAGLSGIPVGDGGNPTTFTGIANVAAGQVLTSGSPAAWSASPVLTGLTVDTTTLFVDSTNHRVGVKTLLPLTPLTVVDTVATSPRGILSRQFSTDTNGAKVEFSKARGTEASPLIVVTGDTLGRIMFRGYDGANDLEMASIDTGVSGTVALTRVPTFLAFSTATDAAPSVLTERMRIDNAGNVGIGVATVLGQLHVKGNDNAVIYQTSNANSREQIFFYGSGSTLIGKLGTNFSASGTVSLDFAAGSGATAQLSLDPNGNLGFGTKTFGTSAAKVLSLTAGTAPSTSPAGAIQMWSATWNGAATNALFIRGEEGNVSNIGGSTWNITGTLTVSAIASNAAAQTGYLCYNTTGGVITYDGTNTCLVSLEEYKENFGPIRSAMAIINKLQPFWGKYKEHTPMSDHYEQPFLGAHQVEGVDKRLVTYNDAGVLKSVRYQNLPAVLVAGMQELEQRITQLERGH